MRVPANDVSFDQPLVCLTRTNTRWPVLRWPSRLPVLSGQFQADNPRAVSARPHDEFSGAQPKRG